MSSNASTAENGVSAESATIPVATDGIDIASEPTNTRTTFDVEREILCDYIEELERELVRERQRRDQVVDHYEQLLDAEQSAEPESTGLLYRLF